MSHKIAMVVEEPVVVGGAQMEARWGGWVVVLLSDHFHRGTHHVHRVGDGQGCVKCSYHWVVHGDVHNARYTMRVLERTVKVGEAMSGREGVMILRSPVGRRRALSWVDMVLSLHQYVAVVVCGVWRGNGDF